MSRPLTSSSASTTARCFLRMSISGGRSSVERVLADVGEHRWRQHRGYVFAAPEARAYVARGNRHRGHGDGSCFRIDVPSRSRKNGDLAELFDLRPAVPGVAFRVLIRSHEQHEKCSRKIVMKRTKRIER